VTARAGRALTSLEILESKTWGQAHRATAFATAMSDTMAHPSGHDTAPATADTLRRTPLTDLHIALGAKMVPFAGYLMPVQYPGGITSEHTAVRERCGLFDVSHMGEFEIRGPDAVAFAAYATSNDVRALAVGQVQYSTILNARGTIEDDCLVYRFADRVMLVVNASNRDKDWRVLQAAREAPRSGDPSSPTRRFDCTLTDVSDAIALLALQGPDAQRILQLLTETDLDAIRYYWFVDAVVAGVPVVLSRTGYTGEDGFELYGATDHAAALWRALTQSGEVTPAGLGARDTLRLEMGMALYGHEIDDTTTPLEANLGWVVKLQKDDFIGRDALVAQKAAGLRRRLVGFTTTERAFPRQGYPVYHAGVTSGLVSSGTVSPTLGMAIGTCYLPKDAATPGTAMEIEVRGKRIAASVVRLPFYTRGTHR
jgi:aminomethyltransferase